MADNQSRAVYDDHDWAVRDRINEIIMEANERYPDLTVAEKLEWAWGENVRLREQDPTDAVGRDADYYFAARHVIAADKSQYVKYGHGALGVAAWGAYSALKWGTEAIGMPELMRSDPDKPNAPVGGFMWMNRGSQDGFQDRGADVSDVMLHLPSARAPAPATSSPNT